MKGSLRWWASPQRSTNEIIYIAIKHKLSKIPLPDIKHLGRCPWDECFTVVRDTGLMATVHMNQCFERAEIDMSCQEFNTSNHQGSRRITLITPIETRQSDQSSLRLNIILSLSQTRIRIISEHSRRSSEWTHQTGRSDVHALDTRDVGRWLDDYHFANLKMLVDFHRCPARLRSHDDSEIAQNWWQARNCPAVKIFTSQNRSSCSASASEISKLTFMSDSSHFCSVMMSRKWAKKSTHVSLFWCTAAILLICSGMPNTSYFHFNKEDHTLANMLRDRLLASNHILFAAYRVSISHWTTHSNKTGTTSIIPNLWT